MSGRFVALLLMSTVPLYVFAAAGVQVNPTLKYMSKGMVAGVAGLTPGCSVMAESPL
jgi:hypothetical protein